MVVGDVSIMDVPPLSGNPFDSRPIERGRAHEIVGRDEILIKWKEHMHSQSPRLVLLVGERGSGRTSLVNAISSQTDRHFIGYFWHKEDPLNRALDEIAVTFCGHEVPNSMHQKVERIVETLDSLSGPLPLVAFDYPSEVEISSFLPLILPILQRLRAFIVISLSNSQFSSLDEDTRQIFEEPIKIESFSREQIQTLCDIRMQKMSKQKWPIREILLNAILSKTGGNARLVISTLRDLIDEKRGLGSEGALHGLIGWKSPSDDISVGPISEEEKTSTPNSIQEPYGERNEIIFSEINKEKAIDLDSPDEGVPDDIWDDEEPEEVFVDASTNPTSDSSSSFPLMEDNKEPVLERKTETEHLPEKITGWSEAESSGKFNEEDLPSKIRQPSRGIFGLVNRSKMTNDQMPVGPDYSTPIQEPALDFNIQASNKPHKNPEKQYSKTGENSVANRYQNNEEKQVFFSEGELWTVDSELEETLPETKLPPEPEFENDITTEIHLPDEKIPKPRNIDELEETKFGVESKNSFDIEYMKSLNDSERLIVKIAKEREISPSDPEIQARLEVGRPRLSQIYNSLHKSGILAVRKDGRSRLFKLSGEASEILGDV
ncbi:MAG: hypothetical protein CMB61_02705 [Euryarchaeota archaeon]|nr:hypothetical protein [Euryarchaeota archaeon]